MNGKDRPLNEPSEETREAAQPIEEELEDHLAEIDSPEEAEAVVDQIVRDTKDKRAVDVAPEISEEEPRPEDTRAQRTSEVEEAVEAVKQAKQSAGDEIDETAKVIEAAAKEAAALEGESYEAVADAIQEVTRPELQKEPQKLKRPRRYLLDAILHHPGISLAAKLDTELFVLINVNIPRTDRLDRFFRTLSAIWPGGWIYIIAVALLLPFRPRWTWEKLKRIAPPTWAAALIVEGPIKKYFLRRRPFIDVVRAIVVGKKPGNWSFPSGHASAAFGGAYIVGKYIPALRPIVYPLAALVAFSRIYLGAHYPGDVLSGSLFGLALAKLTDWLGHRYWLKHSE